MKRFWLPILVGPFLLFSPLWLGGQALFWGTPALQFIPWWQQAWKTLGAGHLPLWNPLVGMGAPLLANYQSGLFYPLNWIYAGLYWLGGTPAMAWGQAPVAALHLVLAGIGMARLARRLGLNALGQATSGLTFSLCGYLVARAGFLSILSAAAWMPWVLDGMLQVWHGQGRHGLGQVVFSLTMQLLAGHAQTTWYSGLLAGLWGLGLGAGLVPGAPARGHSTRRALAILQIWGQLALAAIWAAALAAVQLLPTAEYLLQSQRAAAVEYERAMTYSFWPWRLLTLVAPNLFGNPAHGNYWGYAAYWEDAVYIGLLPLLLAAWAALRGKGPGGGKFSSFLAAIFLGSILLALGNNTAVFPWLYRHIPTFAMFQAPARFLLLAEFSLALLAGVGAHAWRRPQRRALYWTRLGTAGALAVTLGAGLAWYFLGSISPSFIRATALAGAWGVGSGALSLLAPTADGTTRQRKKQAWSWGVLCFMTLDLLAAHWGLNPGVSLDFYREASEASQRAAQVRALAENGRLYLPAGEETYLKFARFLRFESFNANEPWTGLRDVLLPNLFMLEQIPSANNFDPLTPGRYARWMEMLPQATPEQRRQWLERMNVTVIETLQRGAPQGVRFEPLPAAGQARWLPCAVPADDEMSAWRLLQSGQVNLVTTLILEGSIQKAPAGCRVAPAVVIQNLGPTDSPNQVHLRLNSPAAGWVELSQVWYPGWRAQVNGQPLEVLRSNYLFQAVAVPAGPVDLVVEYRPGSFYAGLLVGLAALLFSMLILILSKPHSRPEASLPGGKTNRG